jgi:hypothetical protein
MKGVRRRTQRPNAKDASAPGKLGCRLQGYVDTKTKTLAQACTSSAVASMNLHECTGPSLHDDLLRTARVNISQASI